MGSKLNILITGASRGMGRAISKKISSRCKKLLITSSCEETLDTGLSALKSIYKGDLYGCYADHSNPILASEKISNWAHEYLDSLDALILNAGMYIEGDLCNINDSDFENNLDVNFRVNHYLVKNLIDLLKLSNNPRIIIIGSTAAYEKYPLVPTYGVAKYALRGYSVNLRAELMKFGIGVTFISPGGTLTDMWEGEVLPENRLLEPEDIAKIIDNLFSLSEQAVVEELIVRPILGDIHD